MKHIIIIILASWFFIAGFFGSLESALRQTATISDEIQTFFCYFLGTFIIFRTYFTPNQLKYTIVPQISAALLVGFLLYKAL